MDEIRHQTSNGNFIGSCICDNWSKITIVGISFLKSTSNHLTCAYCCLQYLNVARSLRYYGYIQFRPCITSYPEEDTRVIISIGDRELNFRLQTPNVSGPVHCNLTVLEREDA